MITAEQIRRAAEELRDELTDLPKTAMIWPFGLDILANSGPVLQVLAHKLNAAVREAAK